MRALAVGLLLGLAACAGPHAIVPATQPGVGTSAQSAPVRDAMSFKFRTLDDKADPRFNELLGINNVRHLVGFYGNGALLHPNHGYVVFPPYDQLHYKDVDFPFALDTQVTSLNNTKVVAGFYLNAYGEIFGFTDIKNLLFDYQDPKSQGLGSTTEIFGINDSNIAVGFYTSTRLKHQYAFQLKITTGAFKDIVPPRVVDTVATGINGRGDVCGYAKRSTGAVEGFLLRDRSYTFYSYPHATSTRFLGITILDRIVGAYVDKAGKTHGFLLTDPLRPNHTAWQSIDDPNGVGTTTVTSINIHYDLVGYYVDRFGKTHGFMATP